MIDFLTKYYIIFYSLIIIYYHIKFPNKVKNILLILFGFFLPISVIISNILLCTICFLSIIQVEFKKKIHKTLQSKWMVSIVLFVLLYYIYFLIFGIFTDTFWIIKRVSLLLLLPILYISKFSYDSIRISLITFLFSMFFSSVISIADNIYLIEFTRNWTWSAFMKYTEHNIYLSFCILITLYLIHRVKINLKYKYLFAFSIMVYLSSLILEAGKMGQITTVFGIIFFYIFHYIKNIKKLVFSLLSVLVICFITYNNSNLIQERYTIEDQRETFRISLLKNSIELIKKNIIVGNGAGSFSDKFSEINENNAKIIRYGHKTPHNNYLYVWIELGVLGLIIFIFIFFYHYQELIYHFDGKFMIFLPIIYLLIMFADSYFLSHNTLMLYIFLSVLVFNFQNKHV